MGTKWNVFSQRLARLMCETPEVVFPQSGSLARLIVWELFVDKEAIDSTVLGLRSVLCDRAFLFTQQPRLESFRTEWNRCERIIGNPGVDSAVSKQNTCCGKGLYCVTPSGFHLTENFILIVLLYRSLHGTCKDFSGVRHLKFAESDKCIHPIKNRFSKRN